MLTKTGLVDYVLMLLCCTISIVSGYIYEEQDVGIGIDLTPSYG